MLSAAEPIYPYACSVRSERTNPDGTEASSNEGNEIKNRLAADRCSPLGGTVFATGNRRAMICAGEKSVLRAVGFQPDTRLAITAAPTNARQSQAGLASSPRQRMIACPRPSNLRAFRVKRAKQSSANWSYLRSAR